MKRIVRHWKSISLAVVVLAMLAVIVESASAGPSNEPRPVDEEHAARALAPPEHRMDRPPGEWVGGLGLIEPASPETRLTAAVAGRIAILHVREGERVEAGAVLVELENGPERAALAAAEADVAVAEAELVSRRRGARPEDREALGTESQAALTRAELSAGVAERLRTASEGGGVSADELDRARRQADADRLAALTASARERAGRSGRREDVLVAQAQIQAALARRDRARAELDRLRIVAPVAGEILEVHYRVGEYVQPAAVEPLIVMGETRTLRARIDIDERDVAVVRAGARAQIAVDAFPGRFFEGRVVEIGRRMGRKNVRTDEPTERIDTKILEVVVELREDAARELVVGQRAMGYVAPR
jgi:HlyD family secretion protein